MSSLPPTSTTKIRHNNTRNSTRASQEDGESCHQSQGLRVPQHQTFQRGSSTRPGPARQKRRVVFRPTVSYREIPSRTTLTSQDMGELWFSSYDFDLNKAESRATIKKVRKFLRRHAATGGNVPNQALLASFDDDETTIRGLEHLRSRSALVELQQQKLQITDAVLRAQEGRAGRRRDAIAAISQKFSAKACKRAIQVGRQDAIDAWQGEAATAGSALHTFRWSSR